MRLAEDTAELLDLFYERDGAEPDWAAIGTRVPFLESPSDVVMELLRIFYLVYEDKAAFATALYAARS